MFLGITDNENYGVTDLEVKRWGSCSPLSATSWTCYRLGDSVCVCVNLPLALIKPQQDAFCSGMLRHFMCKNKVSVSLRFEMSKS